jgi:thioredoxin-related protein
MKPLLTLSLALTLSMTFAQGINFISEDMKWQDVLAKAKAENKIVFVDAHTTWCGPCKWMSANIFPLKEVGDVFNASFVSAKIDMEKGEGVDIASKYAVRAYPTYIFVNGDGELVHKGLGGMPADKFIEVAKAASNPERQYFTMKKRFEKGETQSDFLKNMSYAAQDAQDAELAAKASDAYLATQKEWNTPENRAFIMHFANSIESKTFGFILKNQALFEKEMGKGEVENVLNSIPIMDAFRKFFDRSTQTLNIAQAKEYLNKFLPAPLADKTVSYATLRQYQIKQDMPNVLAQAIVYFDKYPTNNANMLNEFAWMFYENATDRKQLEKAVQWSVKSVQLFDNFPYNDTAAALYFKLGDKKKAKEFAEKAIKRAKETGEDPAETVALLKKIEAL